MSAEEPKSDIILLIIAIYKLITAFLFLAAAIGILHFLNRDVEEWLESTLKYFRLDEHNRAAKWLLNEAGLLTKWKLEAFSAIAFFYSTIFAVEGLGLYFRKRWAEYLVVIITGSLLPVEIYELCQSVNTIKIVILLGNLAILSYLIHVLWKNRTHAEKASLPS